MSDSNKALKEKLLSSRKNGFDRVDAAELEQMEAYCKEYMAFLDAGKTERLCAAETVRPCGSRPDTSPWSGDRH